jgi:hypothetical protein
MTYLVTRICTGRWQITSPEGSNLGIKSTRKAAVTVAGALAGWRGSVVVEE